MTYIPFAFIIIEKIANNYLDENQIRQLERPLSEYFDYIEDLIEIEILLQWEHFSNSINEFLSFIRKYDILADKGSVSHKQAQEKAYAEYDMSNKTHNIISDFDKEIKKFAEKIAEIRYVSIMENEYYGFAELSNLPML